jgi:putative membrane protein
MVAAAGGWLRYRQADQAIRTGRDLPTGTSVHVLAAVVLVVIVAAGISVVV